MNSNDFQGFLTISKDLQEFPGTPRISKDSIKSFKEKLLFYKEFPRFLMIALGV